MKNMLPPCHAQQKKVFPTTLLESLLQNASRASHSRVSQGPSKTSEQRRQELIEILEMALELSASFDDKL